MGEAQFNTGFFLRSVAFSYANKIVLLAAGFLYVFLIANQLGPEQFGVYSYLLDLAGTVLFLFGMETFSEVLRVFIPKTSSAWLVRRIAMIQLAVALVLAAAVFLFAQPISAFIARGGFIPFEWLAALVLFLPVSSLAYAIAVGNRQFVKLVFLTAVENISNLVLAAVLVWGLQWGLLGVFVARIVSLALLGLAGFLWLKNKTTVHAENQKAVGAYAKQSWITVVLKKIGLQANLVYVGLFVSSGALGFFYLLQKVSIYLVEMPVNIITETLLPFASEKGDNIAVTEALISRSLKLCVLISVSMACILLLAAPVLVSLFFPAFSNGLELVPLFALYYGLSFDFALGTFFRAINQPKILTYTYVVSAANSLAMGYFLISGFLIKGFLATLILGRLLGLFIFVFFARKSGYRIEFVPRKSDLDYFWALGIRTFQKAIAKVQQGQQKRL